MVKLELFLLCRGVRLIVDGDRTTGVAYKQEGRELDRLVSRVLGRRKSCKSIKSLWTGLNPG
jgi:hypothetical protein